MKKTLSFVLILTFLLSMSACGKPREEESFSRPIGEGSSEPSSDHSIWDLPEEEGSLRDQGPSSGEEGSLRDQDPSSGEEEDAPSGGSIAVTEETADLVPRLDLIPCRAKKEIQWRDVRFYQQKTDLYLRFSLPLDWQLKPTEDGSYEVWRAENQIGWISAKPMKETISYMKRVEVTFQGDPNLLADVSVSWNHRANLKEVYRDINIYGKNNGADFTLNLRVLYGELDHDAEEVIFAGIHKTKKDVDLPIESLEGSNGAKKILIVGDEAMAASRVADFLGDLLADSGYTAELVTLGEAGVKNVTFQGELVQKLLGKDYAYFFLAGLYDDVDISSLSNVLSLCTRSQTKAALFPSYGENRQAIDAVKTVYEGERILDWKAEMEELMGRGIPESAFRKEDGSSTLLAGYVGAHMIYRNLFQAAPPALRNAPLSMGEITATLSDYPKNDHTTDQLAEFTF